MHVAMIHRLALMILFDLKNLNPREHVALTQRGVDLLKNPQLNKMVKLDSMVKFAHGRKTTFTIRPGMHVAMIHRLALMIRYLQGGQSILFG
ncbi:hypothetical protein QR680_014906 [Steinernema hermaphroditum]|uniref:Uncharacterized protein n=1 Tax=Steinernema hermaphroditum TaxID=289476 RepID=A0AA39IAI2_9BILA|nr:hypothetical protein QR680_014906 [Steinernema hermaphroditum]